MAARHGRSRPVRRPPSRGPRTRPTDQFQFERRTIPQPDASIVLEPLGGQGDLSSEWELTCRDGWEWRAAGPPGHVAVRTAHLTADQAAVVREWIDRIADPGAWWGVSRELQSPDSAPEAAQALRQHPWLTEVFPVLLEASSDGSPPPPPDR
jgi:hypothetical protein